LQGRREDIFEGKSYHRVWVLVAYSFPAGMANPDNPNFAIYNPVRYAVIVNFKGMISTIIIRFILIQLIDIIIIGKVLYP